MIERDVPPFVKIAFLGLGAVGRAVLSRLVAVEPRVRVVGALVARPQRSRECTTFASVDDLLQARPHLVIECARQNVLQALGPRILASGTNLVLSSVGALADAATYAELTRAADAGGARMFIPAGALAGIDALAAARHVGITHVCYTRRAPPSTWVKSGAMDGARAETLDGAQAIFEGSARDAALRYPKNANVAATVALAGIGFDDTRVTLIADPGARYNVHILESEGAFGRFTAEIAATPIAGSTSSAIVAGSLVRAVLFHTGRIAI